MKATDTLRFVFRFMNINQKRDLKKLSEVNNNSINQEISAAIQDRIANNKKKIK